MKTHSCNVAANPALAISEGTRSAWHGNCPGWYINQDGQRRPCDCTCHPALGRPESGPDAALPVIVEPAPADGAQTGRPVDEKPRKRPQRAGTCLCGCGAPTNARFAPGHDAKLKSRLVRAARAGDADAKAELEGLGWAHFV